MQVPPCLRKEVSFVVNDDAFRLYVKIPRVAHEVFQISLSKNSHYYKCYGVANKKPRPLAGFFQFIHFYEKLRCLNVFFFDQKLAWYSSFTSSGK